jgi:hypothetical protein
MIKANVIRVTGFALSSAIGWVFYLSWIAAEVGPGSLPNRLTAALILSVFGGFSAALVLMILPWPLVVWIYSNVQRFGAIYFGCAGALLMICLGCAASSVSPKPLFIEDQTFIEGVLIAFERQGLCLALAGSIIGFGYWFFAENIVTGTRRSGRTDV